MQRLPPPIVGRFNYLMNAQELRIGNYVTLALDGKEETLQIGSIHSSTNRVGFIGDPLSSVSLDMCQPILITSELLERFGFEKKLNDNFYSYEDISINEEHIYWSNGICSQSDRLSISPIKFIHQLQNFYFAIIGEHFVCNLSVQDV